MASYIQGITDVIPQVQPWSPNLNFYNSVLGTKQAQYNQGWQQVNTVYNSILNAPMMREDTNKKRDTFFEDISDQIKKISSVDLSLPQNVNMASDVFKPFYEDNLIVKDLSFTKKYQDEMKTAEMYRRCLDDKCKGKYWKGGVKALQYKAQEFTESSADKALQTPLPEYVPYVNAMEKYGKAVKDLGFNVKYDTVKDGYMVTTKNGEAAKVPILNFLMSRFQDDPELQNFYNTKSYLTIKENPQYAVEQYNLAMQGYDEKQASSEAEKKITKTEYDNSKKLIQKTQDSQIDKYNSLTDQEKIVNKKNENGEIIPGTKGYDEFDRILNSKAVVEKSIDNINGIQKNINTIDQSLSESGIENNMQQIQSVLARSLQFKEMMGATEALAYRDYEQTRKVDKYALARFQHSLKKSNSANGSGNGSGNNPIPVKFKKAKIKENLKDLQKEGVLSKSETLEIQEQIEVGNKQTIDNTYNFIKEAIKQEEIKKKKTENHVTKTIDKEGTGDNELLIAKTKFEDDELNIPKSFQSFSDKINYMSSKIIDTGQASKQFVGENYVEKLLRVASSKDTENEDVLAAKQELHFIANKLTNLYGIKDNNIKKLTNYNNINSENINNLYNSGFLQRLSANKGFSDVLFDVITKEDGYFDQNTKEKVSRFGKGTDMSFFQEFIKTNPNVALNVYHANIADQAHENVINNFTSSYKTIQNRLLGKYKNGEAGDISDLIIANMIEYKDGELPRVKSYGELVDNIILGFEEKDLPEFYFTTRDDWGDDWFGGGDNGNFYTHSIKEIENQELKKGEKINLSPLAVLRLMTYSELNQHNQTRDYSIFGGNDLTSQNKEFEKINNSIYSKSNDKTFSNFVGTNLKEVYKNKDKFDIKRDGYNLKLKFKPKYQKEYNYKGEIILPFDDVEVDDRVLELVDEDGRGQYKTAAEEFANILSEEKTTFNKNLGGQGQFIAQNSSFNIPKNANSNLFNDSYEILTKTLAQNSSETDLTTIANNFDSKTTVGRMLLQSYYNQLTNYKNGDLQDKDFEQAHIDYNPIYKNVHDSKVKITLPLHFIKSEINDLDSDVKKSILDFGNTFTFDIENDDSKMKIESLPEIGQILVPNEGDSYVQDINNDFSIKYINQDNSVFIIPQINLFDPQIGKFRKQEILDPIHVNNDEQGRKYIGELLTNPEIQQEINNEKIAAKEFYSKNQQNGK